MRDEVFVELHLHSPYTFKMWSLIVNRDTFLGKWPTWRTFLYYAFISILYMFRASSCSSSGELIISIQHLICHFVTVTVSCAGRKVPFWTAHETVTDTERHIPDVVLIQLILLMMNTRFLETCRAVFLNRRAAALYRALASITPGREGPEETTICYKISLVQLITNWNVILCLSTCHTVYISVIILFMIMP